MTGPGLIIEGTPTVNESVLLKHALALLERHYPGFIWGCEIIGGLLRVRNASFHGRFGFTIELLKYTDRKLIWAGGEILERFRQRRGRVDYDAIDELPTNVRGEQIPER